MDPTLAFVCLLAALIVFIIGALVSAKALNWLLLFAGLALVVVVDVVNAAEAL